MAALLVALRALGPMLVNILLALLSERFLKAAIYRLLKWGAEHYSVKAAKTEDKEDDAIASMLTAFVRDVQIAFKIEF